MFYDIVCLGVQKCAQNIRAALIARSGGFSHAGAEPSSMLALIATSRHDPGPLVSWLLSLQPFTPSPSKDRDGFLLLEQACKALGNQT